jgi:signal transduction histidine kinase/DNA-binding response OmpR family regulator
MTLSFRAKLLVLVVTAASALIALVVSSAIMARRVEGHLDDIRRHYLPKVGLRPQLEAQFERIQRGFQDAVAASDSEKLARTVDLKNEFLRQLAASSDAVEPDLAATLAKAVEEFYAHGLAVSTRLIGRETGEAVVAQMAEMQTRQTQVAELLARATVFDKEELTNAFRAADDAQRIGSRVRVGLSLACLVVVLLLSLWISRDMLSGMAHLTVGFRRFGEGDFRASIPVVSGDEIGDLARQANQMAQSLQRLETERNRVDWLRSSQSALSEQLRGELEPREVADRALSILCRTLGCPVGAVYFADQDGVFRLLGRHGLSTEQAALAFRPGEGLVGQAALQTEILVVQAPADQLRITSGLADGSPRAVVLVPLFQVAKVTGVLELASLQPWTDLSSELLASVRETLAIALDVARGRAELGALLAETQRQTHEVEAQRGALEDKNAALLETRRRLEQQAEELTRASAYKSNFLANMSHELRTPLNAILGFTEMLHDGVVKPDSPQHREFLGDVLASGRHLLQLINDVLDLAKVESGKIEFHPEPVDLADLIGEVAGILRTTVATKSIRLVTTVEPSVTGVIIDPARLKQILYNYLSNALKFTPDKGNVAVRVRAEDADRFRLEVEDTGIGIKPADLEKLFREFQQLDEGAGKRHGGTGLGLALTRRLVEAQGGSVGARSTVGLGSVFHVILPMRSAVKAATLRHQSLPAPRLGAPTVLVIEDDQNDQQLLVQTLGAAGYGVEAATTGAHALALCKAKRFDAITLDLLLPDMTGQAVLAAIRKEGLNRDVPLVVMTVVPDRGAVAGFAVSDILAKPPNPMLLLAALTRVGVTPGHPGDVLVVDDDPGSLKLMDATLAQLGYRSTCVLDPEVALRTAQTVPPSAVVLDLQMPVLDGFGFLEKLRSSPATRLTPVLVWTVRDLSPDERARLGLSAQAVVQKGRGGAAALLEELRQFLARRPAARPARTGPQGGS